MIRLLGWGQGRTGDMDKSQFGSNPSLEPPQAFHFEQALGQDWNKILMHSWRKIIFKSGICSASVPGGPLMRRVWSRSDYLTIEWRWSCSVTLPCSSTWNLMAEVFLGTWLRADHSVLTPAAWGLSWEQSRWDWKAEWWAERETKVEAAPVEGCPGWL